MLNYEGEAITAINRCSKKRKTKVKYSGEMCGRKRECSLAKEEEWREAVNAKEGIC